MSAPAKKKRAKVERIPSPYIEREFEGIVHADVKTDRGMPTVTIGDVDLLKQVYDDFATLTGPVASIWRLGQDDEPDPFVMGARLHVTLGQPFTIPESCGDGCCADWEDPGIYLDGYGSGNLLEDLGAYDGRTDKVWYRLTGYSVPMVTVTFAHWTGDYKPGDEVTVPLTQAQSWAGGRRLIREHNDQVLKLR